MILYKLKVKFTNQHLGLGSLSEKLSPPGLEIQKKKAKHEAAKNILKKLKAAQDYFNVDEEDKSQSIAASNGDSKTDIAVSKSSPPAVVNIKLPNLETILNSSYNDEEEINGDPIGELQELCVLRKMKPPIYETKLS